MPVPSAPSPPLATLIAFMADQGEANANQLALAASIAALNPDVILAGGDNNYPIGAQSTIVANWAAWGTEIADQKVYPAFGNHDLDSGLTVQPPFFPYLPGNKRYYHFETGDVDVFVLNSGRDSSGTFVEPDGVSVGSVQHTWFLQALAASCRKFKVVMMHHAFVTGLSGGGGKIIPALDWSFEDLGIDVVLHGDTHTAQHIRRGNLDIVDASSAVRTPRSMSASSTLYGGEPGDELVWAYAAPGFAGGAYYATLQQIGCNLTVSYRRASDNAIVHTFEIIKRTEDCNYTLENIGGVLTLKKNGCVVSELPLGDTLGTPTDVNVQHQFTLITDGPIPTCACGGGTGGCGCGTPAAQVNDIIRLEVLIDGVKTPIYAKILQANRAQNGPGSFVYTLGSEEDLSGVNLEDIKCLTC